MTQKPWHHSKGSTTERGLGWSWQKQRVRILARDVSLAVQPGHTSIQNVMRGRVDAIGDDTHPGLMLVRLHIGQASVLAQLTRRAAADLGVALGQDIWVQMKSVALME